MKQNIERAMQLRAKEAAKKSVYVNEDWAGFTVSVEEYIKTYDNGKLKKADLTKPVELVERTNPNTGKTFIRLAFATANPKVFADVPPCWDVLENYEVGDTFSVDDIECIYREKTGTSEWLFNVKED